MIHARRVASAPVVVVVANDDRDGRVTHAHAYGRGLSSVVVFVVARDRRDDGVAQVDEGALTADVRHR